MTAPAEKLIQNPAAAEKVRAKVIDPVLFTRRDRFVVSLCQAGTNGQIAIGYDRHGDITRYYDVNPLHGGGVLVHEQKGDVEGLHDADDGALKRWLARDA